jgi:methionine-rich copper-binding protein CopC
MPSLTRRNARRAFLAAAFLATAHAAQAMSMIEQSPRINHIMDGSAVSFALRFDRPLDHKSSALTVVGPHGSKTLRVRLNAEPNTLYSALGRLEPGDYELRWKARSSSGEMLAGGFPFTVR